MGSMRFEEYIKQCYDESLANEQHSRHLRLWGHAKQKAIEQACFTVEACHHNPFLAEFCKHVAISGAKLNIVVLDELRTYPSDCFLWRGNWKAFASELQNWNANVTCTSSPTATNSRITFVTNQTSYSINFHHSSQYCIDTSEPKPIQQTNPLVAAYLIQDVLFSLTGGTLPLTRTLRNQQPLDDMDDAEARVGVSTQRRPDAAGSDAKGVE